jgi:hypothetical protein
MKKAILFIFLLTLLSCSKDDDGDYSAIFGFTTLEDAMASLGDYAYAGAPTETSFNLTEEYDEFHKNLEDAESYLIFFRYEINDMRIDGGTVSINNDLTMSYIPHAQSGSGNYKINGISLAEYDNVLSSLLGRKNRIMLNNESEEKIIDFEAYAPHGLRTNIKETIPTVNETTWFSIDRNQFEFSWNEDPRNEDGILVMVEWSGAFGNQVPAEVESTDPVKRAVVISDTGHATVPASLFDGIPQGARFNMLLMRSNYEYFTLENGMRFRSSMGTHIRVIGELIN